MNALVCRFFLKLGIAPVCAFSAAVLQTLVFSASTLAQELKPVADSTFGAESSVVTPTSPQSDRIDGGAIRGANLFHSFSQFHIGEGQQAYFANPSGISNILSRVTGSDASRIFGKLGVLGNANLFLINPNGIIFGRNASLDVRGSFVGTTANAIGFGNQGFFSATNPNTPPLLMVNPSAFLFNQIAASIQNNSTAPAGPAPFGGISSGLRVPDGQSLLLVGGDINMDGGRLRAYGGRVDLGGLTSPGTVGLLLDGNNLSLSFPENVTRSEVSLTNGASVRVDAAVGGSIAVNAGNIEILGGSFLGAGIGQGLGSVDSVAGDITLNATGEIKVVRSNVFNNVQPQAVGNGGNIIISSDSLSLTDGAYLTARTYGQGDAGSVNINTRDTVSFDRGNVFNNVEAEAVGNSSSINITTGSLKVINGAQLQTLTRGQGDAGSVNINARDTVSFIGTTRDGIRSAVFSSVDSKEAVGNGGNINITTGSLLMDDGARLQASTRGQGNAGSVNINARDTVFFEESAVFNPVESGAVGNGGDINISTGTLFVRAGAQVVVSTLGKGNAGSLTINARNQVSFDGVDIAGYPSAVFSRVADKAVGNGGDINIMAGSLAVTNGARLQATTEGQGDAGSVNINARDTVSFIGTTRDGIRSAVFSSVDSKEAVGNGGDINITTGSLLMDDGAQLQSLTRGLGDAGSVNINARGTVSFDRSYANSTVEQTGEGKGGDIRITTGDLLLTNGAQLNAGTGGKGDGGSVIINARKSVSFDGVFDGLYPSAAFGGVGVGGEGKGGGIYITTDELSLTNGAQIQASTGGKGDAGNVIINTRRNVSFDGVIVGTFYIFNSTSSSRVYENAEGKGGNIQITTGEFSVTNGAEISTDTDGKGDAGNIQINAKDSVSISRTSATTGSSSALLTDTNSSGRGGDITINTRTFTVSDGAILNLQTLNDGNAGNITVNANRVEVLNGGQLLSTTSGNGRAGKITVNATDQVIVNGNDTTFNDRVRQFPAEVINLGVESGLFVRSESSGIAGDIEVTSPQIRLDNSGRFIAESASGNGGNITLQLEDLLLLRRGSLISATAGTAQQPGDGGNITIQAPNGFIIAVPRENSDITANAFTGTGGRVDINAFGIYGIQPRQNPTSLSDITASSEFGVDGTVELNTPEIDPNSALINLPSVPVDTELAQGCNSPNYAQSSFIITGRGGLPPNPKDILTPDAVQVDWVTLNPEMEKNSSTNISTDSNTTTPAPIVEATGWVFGPKGEVIFTAQAPTQQQSSWQTSPKCHEK